MRKLLAVSLTLALGATAAAQANDYGGIRVFSNNGGVGAPTRLVCGTPFSCTPDTFTALPGDTISALVSGTLNGFFVLAASLDIPNMGCLSLGIPGVVNDLTLSPGALVPLVAGVCVVPDNGRCNGGSQVVQLVTIPSPFPAGAMAFQAAVDSPLSAGGNGLAFSNTVVMSW